MAYKDSGEIAANSNYALGDYSFRIERTSVPGSTNDKIEAICTNKGGKNARKSIQVPSSTQMLGWYVEANDTTADVYAIVGIPKESNKRKSEDFPEGISYGSAPVIRIRQTGSQDVWAEGATSAFCYLDGTRLHHVEASASDGAWRNYEIWTDQQ